MLLICFSPLLFLVLAKSEYIWNFVSGKVRIFVTFDNYTKLQSLTFMTNFCMWDLKHHFWNDCIFPQWSLYLKGSCDQVLKDWYLVSEIWDWRTLWIFIWREWGCSILHLSQSINQNKIMHEVFARFWNKLKIYNVLYLVTCSSKNSITSILLESVIFSFSYLCLISGILMQLAAATAAKGTNRPIRGETCCKKHRGKKEKEKKEN